MALVAAMWGISGVVWGADNLRALPGAALSEGLWFAPEMFRVWLFVALMGAGIIAQIAGLWAKHTSWVILGVSAICGAGLLEYDPDLVVGQIAVAAGLLPLARRSPGKKSGGHG